MDEAKEVSVNPMGIPLHLQCDYFGLDLYFVGLVVTLQGNLMWVFALNSASESEAVYLQHYAPTMVAIAALIITLKQGWCKQQKAN